MPLPRLAGKAEADLRAFDPRVAVAHRREPERPVQAGVLVVAHPDQGQLQEADHRGQDLLAWEAGPPQVGIASLSDGGERPRKPDHPIELRFVAAAAPSRVVAMLLPPPRIAPGGLDMAAGIRADPDVGPGGRDRQRADPGKCRLVADRRAIPVAVGEPGPGAPAGDPGPVVMGVAEAGLAGRVLGDGDGHVREGRTEPVARMDARPGAT